ncbi:TPA: TetR/AcrR family transcriptional regulator [Pseudomonas aeruginosa]|nr:TetR/AcrR family transcriptional regulator [Pseudomonas aeruginosa]
MGIGTPDEEKALKALALALVEAPRANLQELATYVGVSKASLYRFCRTRDELISRVIDLCIAQMQEAIEELMTEGVDPLECLQRFAAKAFEQRELVTFMMKYWDQSGQMALVDAQWRKIIDGFFLRGQQAGVFRIDLPAATLTETWTGVLQSLVDAERRGRVARSGLPEVAQAFLLDGVRASKP